MKDFSRIFDHKKRLIVLHETCTYLDDDILKNLQCNDIVFFDDCLYSQYVFISKNHDRLKDLNINCVIGFSTDIFRRDDNQIPNYFSICAESHDKFHTGEISVLNNYMSINELKTLLEFENVFLACHGSQHLQLQDTERIERSGKFLRDLDDAYNSLKKNNLETDIFVYPYAFSDIIGADKLLKRFGYKYVFGKPGSLRIQFESLLTEKIQYG